MYCYFYREIYTEGRQYLYGNCSPSFPFVVPKLGLVVMDWVGHSIPIELVEIRLVIGGLHHASHELKFKNSQCKQTNYMRALSQGSLCRKLNPHTEDFQSRVQDLRVRLTPTGRSALGYFIKKTNIHLLRSFTNNTADHLFCLNVKCLMAVIRLIS